MFVSTVAKTLRFSCKAIAIHASVSAKLAFIRMDLEVSRVGIKNIALYAYEIKQKNICIIFHLLVTS